MPPDRGGRASKACSACRKQKTRCYEAGTADGACLRCQRLHQSCSLGVLPTPAQAAPGSGSQPEDRVESNTNDRLRRLEEAVISLTARLEQYDGHIQGLGGRSPISEAQQPRVPDSSLPQTHEASEPPTDAPIGPVSMIRDLAAQSAMESPGNTRFVALTEDDHCGDIVTTRLLSPQDASSLLAVFLEHYGRWVAFDETTPPATLLDRVRRSPLLLCACCLIAVRHTTQELAAKLAPQLFHKARSLTSTALLISPQSIEFFQATLILSLWSTTVGQTPLGIDSWLLSGFALQHSLSSELFDNLKTDSGASNKRQLDHCAIWNHLCLAHLHYCVGTRRKAIIGHLDIERCRSILDSDHATNFETRMVAEINLYWILYENCSGPRVDLPKAHAALHTWKQEWKSILDQPRAQFLEMGFDFAHLLVYDQSLKARSARVRESLLSEMIRLSANIIRLAMNTTDDRTRHLTDHIYHLITFAAVTLCRLLHLYESQLASSYNIADLDSLVLTLVSWLHSIGLPCHAAHTLGDVVDAFHKRLRPQARPATQHIDEVTRWAEADVAHFFPELLGIDSSNSENWDLLPGWEPLYESPPT